MKLNLGCRNNWLEGYVNIDLMECKFDVGEIDIRAKDTPETAYLQADIMEIDTMFQAGTVDEIVATHFFEHLTHEQITILLYKLWCLLIPKGKLIITTPDFYKIITKYKQKHQEADFNDVDILHIKVFDTKEETLHRTVWYKEIGIYYLEREDFFTVTVIDYPSDIEVKFTAIKK